MAHDEAKLTTFTEENSACIHGFRERGPPATRDGQPASKKAPTLEASHSEVAASAIEELDASYDRHRPRPKINSAARNELQRYKGKHAYVLRGQGPYDSPTLAGESVRQRANNGVSTRTEAGPGRETLRLRPE